MTDRTETGRQVEDRELLRRHIQGDGEAFTSLVGRFRGPLFNFLYRFTGDLALAEDIFQETFLQLHLSAASFNFDRRLKPWLFTIAANKARDALRSRVRRQAAPLDAPLPGGSQGNQGSYVDLMPADVPPPDASLMNLETRKAVQTIVRQMPDALREVLLLNYFQGFSYKDIAETLNVPLGTVKSRLHSAIGHFANKWKAQKHRHD